MSDTHVEFNRTGYLGRLGGAVKGVLFGAVLFVVSFGLLFWNEGRAVNRTRTLKETADQTISVDPKAIDPANEAQPVHFSGQARGGALLDPRFALSREGVHLRRVAEMYQWDEDERRSSGDGSRSKTYTYKKTWHDRPINSNRFKHRLGHENPETMRVQGEQFTAKRVDVGAFRLPPSLVQEIDNFQPLPVDEAMLSRLPGGLRHGAVVHEGRFYMPNTPGRNVDPRHPQVGDIRVWFKLAPNGPVSVVARQTGGTLDTFETATGPVEILHVGTHSADAMFKTEHTKNLVLAWLLRVGGFALMWIGLAVILRPLRVLADVVGFLGDVAGAGIGLVSGLAALVLSISTIAVSWLFYRPVLGGSLLAVAAAGAWWLTRLRKTGHARFEQQRHQFTTPLPLPPVPARGRSPRCQISPRPRRRPR